MTNFRIVSWLMLSRLWALSKISQLSAKQLKCVCLSHVLLMQSLSFFYPNLRKQPHSVMPQLVSPRNYIEGMSGEIPYWWLPRLEALLRSKWQWHVISCSSDIILRGNQWCYHENVGCSLLASSPCMESKASWEGMHKQQSRKGRRKGELAMISYKFSSLLRPGEGKYHCLKNDALPISFNGWNSWLTPQKCLPYI